MMVATYNPERDTYGDGGGLFRFPTEFLDGTAITVGQPLEVTVKKGQGMIAIVVCGADDRASEIPSGKYASCFPPVFVQGEPLNDAA